MAGDAGEAGAGGPGVSPAGGPVGGFGGSVGVGPGGVTGNPGADAESAAAAGLGDAGAAGGIGGGYASSPAQSTSVGGKSFGTDAPTFTPAAPTNVIERSILPSGQSPGIFGYVAPGAKIGMGITNLAEAMGLEVDRSSEGSTPSGTAGEGGGRDDFLKPAAKPPEQPKPPQYARPGAPQPPGTLGFNPAMTPLQQRAQIATYGTQGNQGLYRSPEVKNYYRDLLLRTGITDQGQIQGFDVLPIEQQYANQVLGQPAGLSPEALIEALYKAGPYV